MPLSCNPPVSKQQKALLTGEAFWTFSLSHYKKQGVQSAALALQDKHKGNVNLALLLIWLDSLNIQFPSLHITLLESSLNITDALLTSYRALRKKIKQTGVIELYQQALQFELQLEKQQQTDLIETVLRIELKRANQQNSLLHIYCCSLNAESLYLSLQAKKGA
ncbi:TIGR02444 family protein [Aliivibrio logei]|uniref:TIGR02444 family protein n=1 Tax=Aliivibrio logei TaxID=688 RepID=UPI0035C90457